MLTTRYTRKKINNQIKSKKNLYKIYSIENNILILFTYTLNNNKACTYSQYLLYFA